MKVHYNMKGEAFINFKGRRLYLNDILKVDDDKVIIYNELYEIKIIYGIDDKIKLRKVKGE